MLKIVVIGAGINGVTAANELRRRGHEVTLLDPGRVPHPLAASTDISKAVRATYGADAEYTDLAERSIRRWRDWNRELGTTLYHETGVMFLRMREMRRGDFEFESFKLLQKRGRAVDRIGPEQLRKRFPAWKADLFVDGLFDPEGGYAESARTVETLLARAQAGGVKMQDNAPVAGLDEPGGRVQGVVLRNGDCIPADKVLATTGAWTPFLFPWTKDFFTATGHPVFHLLPKNPAPFQPEVFPMFGADITTTGYYGFPIGRDGVVKIGRHGLGRRMSPDARERSVTEEEVQELRAFLAGSFPTLADAQIVSTRLCLYCDTNDGNFWIAADPEHDGLVLSVGDSGHGFKFAPVLGEITADAVEEKENALLEKFRWRPEVRPGVTKEAARFLPPGDEVPEARAG